MPPALLCLEFSSIATGILAGDALVKRAPITLLDARHLSPGKYLLLATGEVAALEESYAAAREAAAGTLLDETFLPAAHPDLYPLLRGERLAARGEALGVIETSTVAACVRAADAAAKETDARLIEMQLANQLGGKGYVVLRGHVADVEASVERGAELAGAALVRQVVIPLLHDEMGVWVGQELRDQG
jgi:bacterial microcompartment shell protein